MVGLVASFFLVATYYLLEGNFRYSEGALRDNAVQEVKSFARGLVANIINGTDEEIRLSLSKININVLNESGNIDYSREGNGNELSDKDHKNITDFFEDVFDEINPHLSNKTYISKFARPRTDEGRARLLTYKTFVKFAEIFRREGNIKAAEFIAELYETRAEVTSVMVDILEKIQESNNVPDPLLHNPTITSLVKRDSALGSSRAES